MYSRISNKTYRDAPFTDAKFNICPNYVYSSVEDLAKLEPPENSSEKLVWCRTVGILQSFDGQFYVYGMNSTGGLSSDCIKISMIYLKSPRHTEIFKSIVMPCPVQIFGSVKWHDTVPTVYLKLLQVLTVPRALQIKDTMDHLIDLKSDGPLSNKR